MRGGVLGEFIETMGPPVDLCTGLRQLEAVCSLPVLVMCVCLLFLLPEAAPKDTEILMWC